jgi:hypothetical protein
VYFIATRENRDDWEEITSASSATMSTAAVMPQALGTC